MAIEDRRIPAVVRSFSRLAQCGDEQLSPYRISFLPPESAVTDANLARARDLLREIAAAIATDEPERWEKVRRAHEVFVPAAAPEAAPPPAAAPEAAPAPGPERSVWAKYAKPEAPSYAKAEAPSPYSSPETPSYAKAEAPVSYSSHEVPPAPAAPPAAPAPAKIEVPISYSAPDAPSALEPRLDLATTAEARPSAPAPMPFVAAPPGSAAIPPSAPPGAPAASASSELEPLASLGETASPAGQLPARDLPFARSAKVPGGAAPLTLEQYAALTAELRHRPPAEVLARYGVAGEDGLMQLRASWRDRFARDPALAARFGDLVTSLERSLRR